MTITREEFIKAYCERSNTTWSWMSQYRKVEECACGEDSCEGWKMVPTAGESPQTDRMLQPTESFDLQIEQANDPLRLAVNAAIAQITEQREEILRAFIAKYGCPPDECEQVIENGVWSVRRKPGIESFDVKIANVVATPRPHRGISIDFDVVRAERGLPALKEGDILCAEFDGHTLDVSITPVDIAHDLVTAVLAWWEASKENYCDCEGAAIDHYPNGAPAFVTLAQQLAKSRSSRSVDVSQLVANLLKAHSDGGCGFYDDDEWCDALIALAAAFGWKQDEGRNNWVRV